MLSVIMLIVTPEKYLGIVGIACAWFADLFPRGDFCNDLDQLLIFALINIIYSH